MLLLVTVTYKFIFFIWKYTTVTSAKKTSISTQRDFFKNFFLETFKFADILAHHSSFLGEVVNGSLAELTEKSVPP